MNILLFSPEYRPNLSNMIRTTEFYGFKTIYIYDENGLMNPPNNKVSRADMNHMARVWTAGAVEHIEIKVVEDIDTFLADYDGRVVATVVAPDAMHLDDFTFEENDLIVMGPEKKGLTPEAIDKCTDAIYIPNRGVTDCLNVSVTLGIVVHEALRQLGIKKA